MRIHHLNTGTMCPIGKRLVNGTGSIFQRARMVCHCLLVESDDGLVLVDTGIGLGDIADPPRLGRKWVRQTTPRLDPAETAVRQVEALGFSPERRAPRAADPSRSRPCRRRAGLSEGQGACPSQGIRHGGDASGRAARGALHHRRSGSTGRTGRSTATTARTGSASRACVRSAIAKPDILMIPLPGHTLGHCGIAVRDRDGWLLHAGDAYFHHAQLDARPRMPLVLGLFQRRADMDRATRIQNQERLRRLKAAHGAEVKIVNSHDPVHYEDCRCGGH